MTFHREGYKIISTTLLTLLVINIAVLIWAPGIFLAISIMASLIISVLVLQFFRVPNRKVTRGENLVVSPADGKVVAIEEVMETEVLGDKRLQISIFMSPLNVHINWFPVDGVVSYFKYHPGKYLVAWHPKSSTDNERTTVVVRNRPGVDILIRQIAGAVARRIVTYALEGADARQGSQFGFIKFGSRVDVFLPLGSEVKVSLDQQVKGAQTVLAELPQDIPPKREDPRPSAI